MSISYKAFEYKLNWHVLPYILIRICIHVSSDHIVNIVWVIQVFLGFVAVIWEKILNIKIIFIYKIASLYNMMENIICLQIPLSVHPFIHLFIHTYIYTYIHTSVHPSVYAPLFPKQSKLKIHVLVISPYLHT